VRRWILVGLGVLLVIAGVVWTLQGLDLLGGSGGMNGQRVWAVIGPIVAIGGLVLVAVGWRGRRSSTGSSVPR
jgi:hypothetical protein